MSRQCDDFVDMRPCKSSATIAGNGVWFCAGHFKKHIKRIAALAAKEPSHGNE